MEMTGNHFFLGGWVKVRKPFDTHFKINAPVPLILCICVTTGLACLNRISVNVTFSKGSHLEAECSSYVLFK